jgi:TolA-binding protein
MIYFIPLFIMAVIGFAYAAPFVKFLAPPETTVLVDLTQNNTIVAEGSAVIWYHWQSYAYIALFVIIVCLICVLLLDFALTRTDRRVTEKVVELDEQIRSLKSTEETFIERNTLQIKASLNNEHEKIELKLQEYNFAQQEQEIAKRELNQIKHTTTELAKASKIANFKTNQFSKGAIGQKNRVVNDKVMIAQFLELQNWHIGGEKLTYGRLLNLSRDKLDPRRNKGA